jgi:hypothetical protein
MTRLEIIRGEETENHNQDVLYKGELFTYFDEGLTRKVYANADRTKVIKFLIREDGLNYNTEEFEFYESSTQKDKLAKTEISNDNRVIEQEFVLPIKYSEKELTMSEIRFAGRCRHEVGWNKEGKLVCFDLSEFNKY